MKAHPALSGEEGRGAKNVYKCAVDVWRFETSRSHLRSATAGDLRIPSTKTVTIGRRGFSVAGPTVWNNLSTTLKDFKLTFSAFKRLLKTELFKSM